MLWKVDSRVPETALVSARALSIRDRKSTRLNSSHGYISYAVFCLKKKNKPCTFSFRFLSKNSTFTTRVDASSHRTLRLLRLQIVRALFSILHGLVDGFFDLTCLAA